MGVLKESIPPSHISFAGIIQQIMGSYGRVLFLTTFVIFVAFHRKELRLRLGCENIFCLLV